LSKNIFLSILGAINWKNYLCKTLKMKIFLCQKIILSNNIFSGGCIDFWSEMKKRKIFLQCLCEKQFQIEKELLKNIFLVKNSFLRSILGAENEIIFYGKSFFCEKTFSWQKKICEKDFAIEKIFVKWIICHFRPKNGCSFSFWKICWSKIFSTKIFFPLKKFCTKKIFRKIIVSYPPLKTMIQKNFQKK